jgi:hypothetical protein
MPSQLSSTKLLQSSDGGGPQSPGQLHEFSGGELHTLSPQQAATPKQSESPQSANPSQSLSTRSPQVVSVPVWQSASAQSKNPSQSSSSPSAHAVSMPAGGPQSAVQLQEFSQGLHTALPQQTG